jgi:hypothetical protein
VSRLRNESPQNAGGQMFAICKPAMVAARMGFAGTTGGQRVSLPRGYNEAGAEWLEPWCDEHPDLDGQGCVACIGASHDAWMHRAKAAEREAQRLREAIEQACYALDPNQGERPSPSLAYEWLRTTFPADHPNYVAREALEAGER